MDGWMDGGGFVTEVQQRLVDGQIGLAEADTHLNAASFVDGQQVGAELRGQVPTEAE